NGVRRANERGRRCLIAEPGRLPFDGRRGVIKAAPVARRPMPAPQRMTRPSQAANDVASQKPRRSGHGNLHGLCSPVACAVPTDNDRRTCTPAAFPLTGRRMDHVPVTNREEDALFKSFVGHYDAPAYIRRARHVEEAFQALLANCAQKREKLLEFVKLRLGVLRALAGDWAALDGIVQSAEDIAVLRRLEAMLTPRLRVAVAATRSPGVLRRALTELIDSLERFNLRWSIFVSEVDLAHVNALRAGYNRYYVIEKEFAVRSARVARRGFVPLPDLTQAAL